MKTVLMTCANKYAQQPGVRDTPIMVVFNGPRGTTCHVACDTEDDANQFKLHDTYLVDVTSPVKSE